MTVAAPTFALKISYKGLLLTALLIKMKKCVYQETYPIQDKGDKTIPCLRQNGQNRYPVYDQNG